MRMVDKNRTGNRYLSKAWGGVTTFMALERRPPAAVSRLSMPHAATTKGCLILCTVLGLTSNLSATPRMVSPVFRAARISRFELGRYAGPGKLFAVVRGPPEPGAVSFLNHRSLELGKHAHHLK